MLKINLQTLAEGDPADPAPAEPTPTPTPKPTGKTFSEDYVQSVREESKNHRLARKAAEAKLRSVIGLKDDEDIDDAKITAYQARQASAVTDALARSNNRLITAEIKSLQGYDPKLVERLIDRTKIKIADDDKVTGLTEQLAALETEFPAIKLQSGGGGANPPASGKPDTETAALRKSMGLPPL